MLFTAFAGKEILQWRFSRNHRHVHADESLSCAYISRKMAAFLFCASHWTLVDSMCTCCVLHVCVCATSRRRRRRRRRWHRVCETHENTFAEIIWWRAKIGTGWDPRGRSSSASRKLTTKEIREIQEEVPRLKNPEYFPERERRIGERFSEGFSETDGRFVLSSPSLCLFLDPRETRVPPSSRLGGDCVGYCPGANTRRMTIKKILERTHRDESMNTRRTRLSSDFLVELLAKCLSRMNKLN